jgi:hypothetical protein
MIEKAPRESNVTLCPDNPFGHMPIQLQELHARPGELEADVAGFIGASLTAGEEV